MEERTDQYLPPASLRNFLHVLFKRKRIILTFFITVVLVVTAGSFILPKIYQSESKLLIEKETDPEKAMLFRINPTQGYDKYDYINSEIEILNSYPIAARVVKNFEAQLLEDDGEALTADEETDRFEKAVRKFFKTVEIENPKNSTILIVRYKNKQAALSAAVVNYFVNTYITYRSEISSESDTYKFFEEQMNLADQKLQDMEQRQAQFKEQKEVGIPAEQRSILLTRVADYERSLTNVQTTRIGKEAKLSVIKAQLNDGGALTIPSTESSDSPSREKYIAKLKGELLDMEIRKEKLLQKFTPQYEEVKDLEQEIAATRLKIKSEIEQIVQMEETAISALAAEESVLKRQINKIKSEIRDLAQNEYEYSQISRGIDEKREIYSMLLKQREEARLSLAKLKMGVKIKIISPAITPREAVKPKKALNIILSIFLGLFGGLGLAFFVEYFDHTLTTPDELERFGGLPSLGSVREIEKDSAENGKMTAAGRILE